MGRVGSEGQELAALDAAGASLPATFLDRVRARRAVPDPAWFAPAVEWNREMGADPELLERAARLGNEGGVVVLTGQQVGLFGGPLYTLYKLLSAVALAEEVERATGVPALPVFWVVGDDSDFGEVSTIWFPDASGRAQRIRDAEEPEGGTLIGPLSASRHEAHLAELAPHVRGHRHGEFVLAKMEAALARAGTWSDLHAALFHGALGNCSALFLDGGSGSFLSAVAPWLGRAAEAPLSELLSHGVRPGEEPVLQPELGDRALFRIAGGRRDSLADTGDTAAAVLERGEFVAPNVVLRPLLQDRVLPNVATICGPSEIRYRHQLGPVYRHLDVPEPLRPSRFSATLLPDLGCAGASDSAAYLAAGHDPAAFVEASVEASLPAELVAEFTALREQVRTSVARLEPALGEFDKSLPQLVMSAAGKADYQFDRMLDGIRGKTKHRLQQRCPSLGGLSDFVLPRQRPQERSLSWWTPFATDGPDVVGPLLEAAREHVMHAIARSEERGGADDIVVERTVFRLEGIGS
ncbi:MAG: bacillithiol biosynthesis BshC [Candidatus Eisenbacteria bacterium]